MPSESPQQRATRPATMMRVRRHLRDIGREDVEQRTHVGSDLEDFFVSKHETVAEAAARVIRRAGPPLGVKAKLAAEIKMMLHASRDAMRIRWRHIADPLVRAHDPTWIRFDANDSYYGEAFGIVRAMQVLGWGEFGAINDPDSLTRWFDELQREVLAEENFGGSGCCDWCLSRYGRDDAGRSK